MWKRVIIIALVLGVAVFLLLPVLKKEHRIAAFKQNALSHDTIIDLSGYSPIKKINLFIQNAGNKDAVFYLSPLNVNTLNDSTLVKSLMLDLLGPEQKCIRIWQFTSSWTDHGHPALLLEHNYYSPAMMINGIEEGLCDKRNATLANLAERAGIPSRVYQLKGHVVAELFYNNGWHMFDADKEIYYRRPDGEIADVAYLNLNPQLISAETKNITGFVPKWRNEATRRSLSPTNKVDARYKTLEKDYSAVIRLLPGEELCYDMNAMNLFKRLEGEYVEKRENPQYKRKGTRTSVLKMGMLKPGAPNQKIYACHMPYPITGVKISNKSVSKPVKVYYSPDSIRWYLKGAISAADDCVAIDAFDKDRFSFTFRYYLKFEGKSISENEELSVETEFTFSEKVMLTNPEKAFAIHFADSAAHNLNVHVTVVE